MVGVPDLGRTDRRFSAPRPALVDNELHEYARAARSAQDPAALVPDTFPLTGSGKIQKFKLREQWAKGEVTEL